LLRLKWLGDWLPEWCIFHSGMSFCFPKFLHHLIHFFNFFFLIAAPSSLIFKSRPLQQNITPKMCNYLVFFPLCVDMMCVLLVSSHVFLVACLSKISNFMHSHSSYILLLVHVDTSDGCSCVFMSCLLFFCCIHVHVRHCTVLQISCLVFIHLFRLEFLLACVIRCISFYNSECVHVGCCLRCAA
jgi:hypothetical protein